MGTFKKNQNKKDCSDSKSTQSRAKDRKRRIVVNLKLRTEAELLANRSSAYEYII